MPSLLSVSLDTYLATALAISVSWLYFVMRTPSSPPKSRTQTTISVVLLLHTLYILHSLLLKSPPNLFNALKLPLNTPTDSIRAILLQFSDDGELPGHLESLLKRLGSLDMRGVYVRFGHNVLTGCEYCHNFDDFLLFSIPRPLLSYIREIAIVGLVTMSSNNRAHLRPVGVGALIISGLTETYYTLTSPVVIPPRGSDAPVFMLHDTFLLFRRLLFLLLPLSLQYLPSIIPPSLPIPILTRILHPPPTLTPAQKAETIQSTLQTLDHLVPALHIMKYTRAALMRLPQTRERAESWWTREKDEGEVIRHDEGVKRTARASGLGYDAPGEDGATEEGKLKTSAKMAIDALKGGVVPSEHWRMGP
ncbi:hypothetical protein BDQ12DRAFT_677992 [Crucibulum laeve]|uniref:Uncharacterized protein n=1 Tax=Crucibulum laeve TaxID=68775 RepID=A0A5C3M9Q1_9AGAR|nr:hypothetical protein BDQ12DRAFT_677992 [Crucibulum laeve]